MSQQAVPAPEFRQPNREPSGPKPLNLRWGLGVLGLIIAGGIVFSRVWEANFQPEKIAAVRESPAQSTSDDRGQTVDTQPAIGPDVSIRGSGAATPVVTANYEELEAANRAQRAVESVRRSKLRALAEEGRSDLTMLKAQLAAWNEVLNPLMNNDRGRVLASDPDRLRMVATILENSPATEEQVASWERNLMTLLEPLQESADEAALRLPDEFVSELDALLGVVRQAREDLTSRRATINTILAQIGPDLPQSESPTLREALERSRGEEAQKRAVAIAEAQRQARADADKKLAEAEAARVEAENRVKLLESQARKEEAEGIERKLADARAEAAKQREDARQKAELIRRFEHEWPRMQTYLVPFTSAGFTQPGGRGFERTTEKGPVSFGRLQGAGVLDRDINSLKKLYYSTTANGMNDRDHGGFPKYFGGAQDWNRKHPTIQLVQDFLNEFGPIMVEKGLLAP